MVDRIFKREANGCTVHDNGQMCTKIQGKDSVSEGRILVHIERERERVTLPSLGSGCEISGATIPCPYVWTVI